MNQSGRARPSALVYAILSFLLPAIATGGAITIIGWTKSDLLTKPEVQLPIVLIATVLAVLGGLSFLVIVLAHLGLTDRHAALGMPEGSIRAVIAISLLLLFMILAVFLYADLAASGNPGAKAASPDIAKQLITTVATLAVSVAGFYFGTSSVAAATKAVAQTAASLRLVSPSSPQIMEKTKDKELAGIRLEARPTGAALSWDKAGDDDGQLMQTEPYVFTYRRGSKPADLVSLNFALENYPDVTAKLDVQAAARA